MGLVALTYQETEQTIAAKERESLLRSLHALIPDHWFDNEIVEDMILVSDQSIFGTKKPVTVYRANRYNCLWWVLLMNLAVPTIDNYTGQRVLSRQK